MKTRVKKKKPAVTRDEVYTFAHGCIEHGEVETAAVAVICFEWLQRPENVIAGHIKWSSYRTGPKPTIRIEHHKTGEIVDHPLEDGDFKFCEERIVTHNGCIVRKRVCDGFEFRPKLETSAASRRQTPRACPRHLDRTASPR
jgi:hypothetical protein